MSDESNPTTLYVGNLDHSVSEELLCALFSQIGFVRGCKVIREPGNDPYAFVDFGNHQAAATALGVMNKRVFLDKEMKVNWATSPGNQPKLDTSNHHHIFVGDLSPEIETQTLRDAFAPFGEISNCRIVRDPQTLRSKGYAFVSFVKKAEAENAIMSMNGQWLGNRSIRTNWSTRKPPPPRDARGRPNTAKQPTYDEVYNQSSPTNCTVYCGGFANGICDNLIQSVFAPYGNIQDIRCFAEKGYAFIKFASKEEATHAIEGVHNTEINGQVVKCFWGKESSGESNSNNHSSGNSNPVGSSGWPSYMYPSYYPTYYQQGYSTGPPSHMGQTYVPNYSYNNQYGYHQNYVSRPSMPNTWPQSAAGASAPSPSASAAQQMQPQDSGMSYVMSHFQSQ